MRKISNLITQRNEKFEHEHRQNQFSAKSDIREALDMQLKEKRERVKQERNRDRLVLNTCRKAGKYNLKYKT